MKKRIIFLIAFVIIIAMFSGCKKKEEDNKGVVPNNNKEQVQEIEKPLNETYQLNESTNTIETEMGENVKMLEEWKKQQDNKKK